MKKITSITLFTGVLLLGACGSEADSSSSNEADNAGNANNTAEEAENNTAAESNETEENNEVENNSSEDNEAENEAAGEETLTITHELGETEVPVNPERVVVFDFGVLDTMQALGEEPIALPQANVPSYLSDYAANTYENAGTLFEPDFEAIYGWEPDLIIIGGRTAEAYDDLNDIAPTVLMAVDQENYIETFEEQVTTLGEIFDKEEAAAEALADVQEDLEALQAETGEENGLMVMVNEGSLSAYGPGSRFGILHNEFGITPADENIEDSSHGQNVSFEYVLETNPDTLFVLDRGAVVSDGEEESAEEVLDNDIINQTNAAQNDNIVHLSPDYWYLAAGGVTSVKEMIAEVQAGISE
ncbi:siderophore ABC transporter substrate-binding protein [Alkalicoccus daliensis]|uniref:Iron complex transport system substrate-binding protein n=1 Tax=Alkalicoccus daliensis TaxID=745820 RepID=A0A1H0G0I7_9BACI|nr:siderophore ABC transporter substrate-binding protein [Alkalicoccus daliensis]SDO00415.1 iron complex transport system substrate-binding protein [Alkalicoccus daliensis]